MTTGSRKRALVTGGSGGLGSAIAERLARDGAHVVVHANSRRDAAEAVVARIVAAGGSAEAVAFDVTDAAATRAALDALLVEDRSRSSSTTPACTTTPPSRRCAPSNGTASSTSRSTASSTSRSRS
jgi:nucleoside-diphosphate-sugar epimerase